MFFGLGGEGILYDGFSVRMFSRVCLHFPSALDSLLICALMSDDYFLLDILFRGLSGMLSFALNVSSEDSVSYFACTPVEHDLYYYKVRSTFDEWISTLFLIYLLNRSYSIGMRALGLGVGEIYWLHWCLLGSLALWGLLTAGWT